MHRGAVVVLLLCAVAVVASLRAPEPANRKQLAGPPSEFAQFAIPDPSMVPQDATSAFIDILLTRDASGMYTWTGDVQVDSSTGFSIGLFAEQEETFELVVGSSIPAPKKEMGPYGIDGDTFPFTTWRWANPAPGTWTIQLKSSADLSKNPKAIIVTSNDSPVQLYAHLNTYDLQVDQEIGVVAHLYDSLASPRQDGVRPTVLRAATLQAEMDVTFPGGKQVAIAMHDDGLHADLAAEDGIYGAVLEAVEPGTYTARTVFKGTTAEGRTFMRTTNHFFSVVTPDLTLTGLASATLDNNLLRFNIDVDTLASGQLKKASAEGLTVRTFAEVWGTDASGYEVVPVAWMQAMVDPVEVDGHSVLPMQLDATWVHKAQAQAPFQLRNVWIEERNTNVPLSRRDRIFVESKTNALRNFRPNFSLKDAPITPEMRVGPKPRWLANLTSSADAPNLFLVHGYCASSNEFPTTAFTNAVQFADFKASRSVDDFALRITAQAEAQGMGAFSIVAHSQGGLASTHLNTYYWSKLQATNANGRLIQTVGSPYGGCGFAGSLAGIGTVIGKGCGSNYDLTYDGATLWQQGIPAAARTDTHFYTTVYGDDGYCAWGANMVLYTPNDGTTELKVAKLSGGVDMGTKTDWCHTTDMIYPNQCADPERNAEMNAAAAR